MSRKAIASVIVIGLCCCLIPVLGHSWLACSDYRGEITGDPSMYSNSDCQGYGRDWSSNTLASIGSFGTDRGYNYQPGGGRTCRNALDGSFDYTEEFPQASYNAGQIVRIVWPAKNHARVRDHGLRVYGCCGSDCTSELEADVDAFATSSFLIKDFGVNPTGGDIGFGNCPDLDDTDRAVCFGDFVVPSSFSGECTFLWFWAFNSDQDVYTTCWEATVSGGNGGQTIAPETQAPTESPTDPPTESPMDPPTESPTDPPTESPTESPTDPPTESPTANQIGECVPTYAQCGGVDFQGSTCCADDDFFGPSTCTFLNRFYSQCLPSSSQGNGLSESTAELDSDSQNSRETTIGAAIGISAGVLVALGVAVGVVKRSRRQSSTMKKPFIEIEAQ